MRNLKQHMPGGYTEQYMDTEVAIYCSRCVYPEGICGTKNSICPEDTLNNIWTPKWPYIVHGACTRRGYAELIIERITE